MLDISHCKSLSTLRLGLLQGGQGGAPAPPPHPELRITLAGCGEQLPLLAALCALRNAARELRQAGAVAGGGAATATAAAQVAGR